MNQFLASASATSHPDSKVPQEGYVFAVLDKEQMNGQQAVLGRHENNCSDCDPLQMQ